MRRYFSLLCILALLVGCYNTDEQLINEQIPSDGRIFTASFEQNDTRTYVEEGNLLRWNEGDQITIFDSNTLNQQYKFDGETGDNGGTFSKVSNSFGTGNDLNCHYAVYPYNKDIKITETGVITANLPAEQSYAENSFGLGANTMVAVTKDTDDTFLKFRNVGGYLKLQLYGENVTVKSITLTGNNNEKLAGKATITPAYGQSPTITMGDDSTTSITLDCGEGVKIGTTEETATAFWIVVPPTIFENGFTITITDCNGKIFTKSTSNAVVIERNIIKPMVAFEIEKVPNNQIWYTATEKVQPYATDAFGTTIISNAWDSATGKGIITFNGKVTKIGFWAFNNCSNLTSITTPDSVTEIGEQAFDDCSSLTSVDIGNGVTSIGEYAFADCISLTSITIPDSVIEIVHGAFSRCSGLTSVIVGNSVTSIGEHAFSRCTSLIGVTIGNSVSSIGKNAFYYCKSLTSITIPNSVTSIGEKAFYQCSSLTSITIPNSVTSIEGSVFAHCYDLTTITIPNSVTSIGEKAFYNCNDLIIITIPESISLIKSSAFDNCSSLTSVYCKPTIPPAGGSEIFDSNASGRKIYVPRNSVEAYKSAEYWSEYASSIEGYDF